MLSRLPTFQKGNLLEAQHSKEVEGLGSDPCALGAEVGRALLSSNTWLHLPWPELHRPYPALEPPLSKVISTSGPKQKGLGRLHYVRGFKDPQRGPLVSQVRFRGWTESGGVETLGVVWARNSTQIRFKKHCLAQLLM